MIGRDYCVMMARYNAWQNTQLHDCLKGLDLGELKQDRGGFFGGILETLSHIAWADLLWMARLDQGPGPSVPAQEHTTLFASLGEWNAERFRLDGRIRAWTQSVTHVDLAGTLCWESQDLKGTVTRPVTQCVVHMFNHQTHHRGQIHGMLTGMGMAAPVSDLAFLTEEF